MAVLVPSTETEWHLGPELRDKIEHSGFQINDKKTRMQLRVSRQVTTGLMVNEKVNIRQEYWRAARQMCQSLFNTGTYHRMVSAALKGGAPGDPPIKENISTMGQIAGIMAHIYQVKEHADLRKDKDKRDDPTAARKLYRRFLFYKNFVASNEPVIVPEGKTDSVYLRCAIWKLAAFHPRLGSLTSGEFESKVRLMSYSATIHNVLNIGQGATQLKSFVENYRRSVSGFSHAPLAFPAIILVDNDDGGKKLFGLARAMSKVDISFSTTDPFYYLGINLYLVKTPEQVAAPHTSCMETFFDATTLATVIDGKTFDPDKDHDAPGKYGKTVFATKVVEPNSNTIDFSGFAPLLARIVAVLDHHAGLKAASPAAAG